MSRATNTAAVLAALVAIVGGLVGLLAAIDAPTWAFAVALAADASLAVATGWAMREARA